MPDPLRHIPTVGKPYEVRSWVSVVNAECKQCQGEPITGRPFLLTMVLNLAVVCPGCGAEYTLRGLTVDHQSGEASFAIAYSAPNAKRLQYEQHRHGGH